MMPPLLAVAAHLWQSTLLAAMVWLATVTLRRHRARVRYWLWTAASLKFLIPLSALVTIGARAEWHPVPATVEPAASFVVQEVFAPLMQPASTPAAQDTGVIAWLLLSVWVAGSIVVLRK
jgi:hypothetical protein